MSKTLIINGSPRKKGETAYMMATLKDCAKGEIKVLDAYRAKIQPCIDCRYCFKKEGCAVQDGMQEYYDYIQECDHIILASPIYFGELSGQLLAVLSRLQTYFSARYIRKEEPIAKPKTGAILLCAGSFGPKEKSEDTAAFLLKQLRTTSLGTIYADYTDRMSVQENEKLKEELVQLARQLEL